MDFFDESTVLHDKTYRSRLPFISLKPFAPPKTLKGTQEAELFSTSMHHLLAVQTHPTVPLAPSLKQRFKLSP